MEVLILVILACVCFAIATMKWDANWPVATAPLGLLLVTIAGALQFG